MNGMLRLHRFQVAHRYWQNVNARSGSSYYLDRNAFALLLMRDERTAADRPQR